MQKPDNEGQDLYQPRKRIFIAVLTVACLLVQVVNVLGDDPSQMPFLLELGQRLMSRIAELAEQGVAECPVKFPGLFRSTQKDLESGILVGGIDRP